MRNLTPAERVFAYAAERGFRGADPYDALNSPLLAWIGRVGKWPRIACIQAVKRSPLDLRPLLGVPSGLNPKALGLFLGGWVRLGPATEARRNQARRLLELLEAQSVGDLSGAAWGYDFPWQSRAFYLPRNTPTVVNTSIIGHAILDYADWAGDDRWRRFACTCADFIHEDLNRTPLGEGTALSYSPIDETAIHNATILGGSLLARVAALTGNPRHRELAAATARCLVSTQRRDGSWPYAETSFQAWVDVFHSGFVLDALREIRRWQPAKDLNAALRLAGEHFRSAFFEESGRVKYATGSSREADAHGYAQALVTVAKMVRDGEPGEDALHATRTRFLSRFVHPDGRVRYRSEPWWARGPHYMRWAQAWGFMGLAVSEERGES